MKSNELGPIFMMAVHIDIFLNPISWPQLLLDHSIATTHRYKTKFVAHTLATKFLNATCCFSLLLSDTDGFATPGT